MAEYIRYQDLPEIASEESLIDERFLSTSQTAFTIEMPALFEKLANHMNTLVFLSKTLFGETDPDDSIGTNGDNYYKILSSPTNYMAGAWVKYNGHWLVKG